MEIEEKVIREYWIQDCFTNPGEFGKDDANLEAMASKLLDEDILYVNCRQFVCPFDKSIKEDTLVLFVLCNDVFAWALADGEPIDTLELPRLFKLYEKNNKCGSIQWVCIKRNQRPQYPMAEYLKENNGWTEQLQKLPYNHYDHNIYSPKLIDNKYYKWEDIKRYLKFVHYYSDEDLNSVYTNKILESPKENDLYLIIERTLHSNFYVESHINFVSLIIKEFGLSDYDNNISRKYVYIKI